MGPTPPAIFYFLVYIVPITAGIIGGKYLTTGPNFCLMIGVLWAESMLVMFATTGELRPSSYVESPHHQSTRSPLPFNPMFCGKAASDSGFIIGVPVLCRRK